jgi:integrase
LLTVLTVSILDSAGIQIGGRAMGSKSPVRKRGSRWVFVVDLPRLEDGKRRQRWLSFPDRDTALAEYHRRKAELSRGTHWEPSDEPLGGYLSRWVKGMESEVRPSTAETYRKAVRKIVADEVADVPLAALNRQHVEGLKKRAVASERSSTSARYTLVVLRMSLNDAVEDDLIKRNVAKLVNLPPKAKTKMQAWNADELRTFLEGVQGDRLYALWRVLATTGMRRGEALALRWDDLGKDGKLHVWRSRTATRYEVEEGPTKTENQRDIPLDEATVTALRSHRNAQAEERMSLGIGKPSNTDYIFVNEKQEPLHPDSVGKMFQAHVRRLGVKRIRLHDLRHTWATLALEAGVPLIVVSRRLGHASTAITGDIYSHVADKVAADAAQKVAELVGS